MFDPKIGVDSYLFSVANSAWILFFIKLYLNLNKLLLTKESWKSEAMLLTQLFSRKNSHANLFCKYLPHISTEFPKFKNENSPNTQIPPTG